MVGSYTVNNTVTGNDKDNVNLNVTSTLVMNDANLYF